jgi:hypothetical protein
MSDDSRKRKAEEPTEQVAFYFEFLFPIFFVHSLF